MDTKPRWIIFDVGSVLFDYRKAMRSVSVHLDVEEEHLLEKMLAYVGPGELGRITFDTVWENILKDFEKADQHKKAIEIFWDIKHWVADTKNLVQELDKKGYFLALFTNNWVGMMKRTLRENPELLVIDKLFESSVEKLRKPEKLFYELVEREIKSSGQEIFFIDDSEDNLATAKQKNWQTFLYTIGEDDGKTSNDLLRKELLGL